MRKVVVPETKEEVISSVRPVQLRAGHQAGCEAAVHAMDSIFNDKNTDAVLLVNAKNTFNLGNREAFIVTVKIICPAFTTFASNCYSTSSRLFIIRGGELKSTEGKTQWDPIAMITQEIAAIPLIQMIIQIMHDQSGNISKLITYADDFIAARTLEEMKVLWNILCDLGPKFGYHPRASKSWLTAKKIKLREHPLL